MLELEPMHETHGLNPSQHQAVTHTEGPLLVLAGAGSGKTRVITFRIKQLIENGVTPANILAVTFTNKAAKEMRERVLTMLGMQNAGYSSTNTPTVTTFHSLGVRILREHHAVLGLPKHFIINDRSDTQRAVKKAIEKAGYNPKEFEPRKILSMISRAKGDAVTRADYRNDAKSFGARATGEIWDAYEEILSDAGALDFDDLLVKTLNLLKSNPDILKAYQERFKYIHVDEFQDTNKIQMDIVKLIAAHKNICVVGDVDQSVYGWRGAKIANILGFERHFSGCCTIKLEENYRSTKTIIAASNAVIEKNINRPEKTAFTNNPNGERIFLHAALSGNEEARHIAGKIKELIAKNIAPSDIAVLYRTNFQSRALEEAMIHASIPYQLLGTKFFERAEVKDVLSYLRLALNPENQGDLARIVNTPSRGIGKVSLEKILSGDVEGLTGKARASYDTFKNILTAIAEIAHKGKLSETLAFIIKESGMEYAFQDDGEDGQERLENVQELVSLAVKHDELPPEDAVERLLEEAALQSDQDEIQDKEKMDAVRLMTVHASKGLEFPYVFIAGLEEGLFPHQSFDPNEKRDTEEERRLFYVALTRAEKRVFLSFAHTRIIFGSQTMNEPSSFLNDIPPEYIEQEIAEEKPRKHGLLDDWGDTAESTIWI